MAAHKSTRIRGTPFGLRSGREKFFYIARIVICFASFGFVYNDAFND